MNNKFKFCFPLLAILGVAITMLTYHLITVKYINGWTERGQFGDMFGGLNTFFSGLAFAGLAYTLILQRRELSLQRLELKLTREELKKQSDAQEQQALLSSKSVRLDALSALSNSIMTEIQVQRAQLQFFVDQLGQNKGGTLNLEGAWLNQRETLALMNSINGQISQRMQEQRKHEREIKDLLSQTNAGQHRPHIDK